MINRIHKALKITSSGEYNIYSAYRSDNLLYNRYRGEIVKNWMTFYSCLYKGRLLYQPIFTKDIYFDSLLFSIFIIIQNEQPCYY